MENTKKINFIETTFVCNSAPNNNFYNKDKLLVGTINSSFQNTKSYKSLLRINKSDLELDKTKNIYLFLFVNDIYTFNGINARISIFINEDNYEFSSINWSNFPDNYNNSQVNINLSTWHTNKYIKVDITSILKSITSDTGYLDLIIRAVHPKSPYVVQFASCNSENTPYLTVIYDSIDDTPDEISDNPPQEDDTEILTELTNQSARLDSLEDKLSNIKNYDTDLNDLVKSEIYQLKNSVNYDIVEFKNSINKDISDLKNTINELNDNLLKLLPHEPEKISIDMELAEVIEPDDTTHEN